MKLLSMAMLTCLLVFNFNYHVVAECSESDFAFDTSTGTILKYVGSENNIIIPSIIQGINVTKLGESAFEEHCYLTSVTIPKSVNYIGKRAFYDCTNLKSIIIPDGVQCIEDSTFYNCWSLQTVNLPDSITDISNYAFYYCWCLTNINLSDRIVSIGDNTFQQCGNLVNITLPESVMSIGTGAFANCASLDNIKIPNNITKINDYTFIWCSNLKTIYLPVGLKSIGDMAFTLCSNLNNITIPNNVVEIGTQAFNECSKLNSMFFEGDAPKSIGWNIFSGTSNIKIYYRESANGFISTIWQGRPCEMLIPPYFKLSPIYNTLSKQNYSITGDVSYLITNNTHALKFSKLIIAIYSETKLLSLITKDVNLYDGENNVNITGINIPNATSGDYRYKIMVYDNLLNLQPLTNWESNIIFDE